MPWQTGRPMQHTRPIWLWRPCFGPRRGSARVWAAARPSSARRRRRLRRVLNTLGICYKGLGRFADATRTLSEAVAVADRCGHPAAIAHSRMCLANQYHDLAFFDSSVRCFRAVLAPLAALASPRASVEAYSSIARFALVLASVAEAEKAGELCEEAAQRSGLWRHAVTALLTKAEVFLSKGQPELAWPLVEEA